jgi:hypothetical protein
MKAFSRGLTTLSLFLISAVLTSAQKVEFSADMRVSSGTGQTQTLKLFVGNMRARFDFPKQGRTPAELAQSSLISIISSYSCLFHKPNSICKLKVRQEHHFTTGRGCSDLTLRNIPATTGCQRRTGAA